MKKLYAMGSAMRMAGIAVLITLLSLTFGGMPATAEEPRAQPTEQASEMSIASIERTDGWEWTGEAIAEAVGAYEEPILDMPSTYSRGLSSTPFPEEVQKSVSFPNWVATSPASVTHKGIDHPSTVGKIVSRRMVNGELVKWSCTGTVVTSTSESLIITAGHCVWPRDSDRVVDMEFIPSYHENATGDAQKPFGIWKIKSVIAPDCWIDDKESACDQAFLKATPRTSDDKTLQSVVGSLGLTIGGSPVRGVPVEMPKRFPLAMDSYPFQENKYEQGNDPDKSRVYRCDVTTEAADQDLRFLGAIQAPCDQPITGGASGAAFVERQPAGRMIMATFIGRVTDTPERELIALLNNATTKTMHGQLNAYVPLP